MTRDLNEQLRSLGLRHTAEVLDDIVALATKNRWGVIVRRRPACGITRLARARGTSDSRGRATRDEGGRG
jgi:hypothetical protein